MIYTEEIRYVDEVFDSVEKNEDVVYGNAPDLPFIFLVEWNTFDIDLDMDIYQPSGDTISNRPAIVIAHTGAFFSGYNELDDVTALSISAAKRGYVVFNINYRLGLNVISTYSAERAVFRATQDGSAAIRYIRQYHQDLGVDPNNIFMWGTSAGAFIALHLSYSSDSDRPQSTYGGVLDPDLGCIDCEGNNYIQPSRPNAIVSCWGAIGDLNWIDFNDNIPAIMFHGSSDPIVPFNSGYPFTIDIALPIVYGSYLIHNRLNELDIENELYYEEGELHEYWGTVNGNWFDGPNDFWYSILDTGFSFLYNQIQFELQPGDNCNLEDGREGFLDCDLCCWDLEMMSWIGDGYCNNIGDCSSEGPQYNCVELGFDCGDCNDSWDINSYELCEETLCMPEYDTNSDGFINILDIINVINYILEIGNLDCSINYDEDDIVSVLDIIIIVNIIIENN